MTVVWRDCLLRPTKYVPSANLFGMQGLIWMRFKMRFSNELYFSERLDKKLLTSSWQIWIFFMNVRNFWDFVQFLWPSYKVRTLLTYQQYNVNVEWLSIKFNISSVVEFQRWWVLKSKIFGQESTSLKWKNYYLVVLFTYWLEYSKTSFYAIIVSWKNLA